MEYKHKPLHEAGEVLIDSAGARIQILDHTESRYFFMYLGEDKEVKAHNDFCYIIDTYFCRDSSYEGYCKSKETMKQEKDFIEVPFGARDSELGGFEYTIPEGFEAEIKDGKVIVRKAENKDERIREWLIRLIKATCDYDSPTSRKEVDDALAWLEKQGEQKSVECCADKLWTEFQKQVAYLMASSYNREYEYTKGYVEWVAQSLLGYAKNEIEHKSAWSEEDERNIKELLYLVEADYLSSEEPHDRLINFLKSLKDRVLPKQEWSEGDIATISRVISIVKWAAYSDHSHPILNDKGATELVERLNSLKERYTWKASDEQMEILQYLCENSSHPNKKVMPTLKSLYQDLKKLMEE